MNQPRASLRSDSCPTSIGIPVRYELEQLSAFIGIRTRHLRWDARRFWMPLGCFVLIMLYGFGWTKLSQSDGIVGMKSSGGH